VMTGYGQDYWTAYTTRLRANTLTNVILVPTIVGALQPGYMGWWRYPLRRYPEAAALFAGLLVVSVIIFSRPLDERLAAIYLPLPFVLWAAVRFGPGVTGSAILIIAFVASWNAVRGVGGFAAFDADRNIVAIQLFLLCMSVPLLSLAMVVREREAEKQKLIASGEEIRRGVERSRDLAGRLISAQEAESNRIARELHDSVGQYVADLALTISALRRVDAVRESRVEGEFQRLFQQTSNLFESVRSLSHQLHPSILRHAGLVAATESLCRAFAMQQDIPCEFEPEAIEPIPEEVALCAYRVAQEALRNVATHAYARKVKVSLTKAAHTLSLTVVDDGRGFDPRAATRGLGLVSMEERVRLVRGQLDIASGHEGSRVSLRIPLEALT
jgi:signal transduction histidine kinase